MLEKVLKQRALISTVLIAVFIGGILSYVNMGKLEDAEIPIKSAMVITVYPGASAHEVELEVTDVLEKAIQKLENVDEIISVSQPGLSLITINIQETVKTPQLPQLWDHLRRKVGDVKGSLPSGAYDPIVNDDFADTYGMLYAVTAEGYTLNELTKYTELIERELLEIDGVRRSQIFGTQTETFDILISNEKLAGLNINPMFIAMAVQNEGKIVNPGKLSVGRESLRIGVGAKNNSMQDLENLLIQVPEGGNFRLGDIAKVERSVLDPKREAFYFNGKRALALGLSNESGVNVVELGAAIDDKLKELSFGLPAGLEVETVYDQPKLVDAAVNNFMVNLVVSVGIVILVLLFSMGYRSGLLISSGLVFTILGTLIIMNAIQLPLHRITLAAIILAMGMLVDNAIVVADGILVDLKKGVERRKAFVLTAQKTALPLLGATAVAILAFLPLRMSPNVAGEFLSSLFTVLVISLTLSWLFAMIQTPFLATYFYRKERPDGENKDSYGGKFYVGFRRLVEWALLHKVLFSVGVTAVFMVSAYTFKYVKVDFMPGIDYDQCVVEYNLPEGSDIESVEKDLLKIQDYIQTLPGVVNTSTSIGRPPARYTLMRIMPTGGTGYGEIIVQTEEVKQVREIIPVIKKYVASNYPDAISRVHTYGAAFSNYNLELEISGPDPKVLRSIGEEIKEVFRSDENLESVTDDWKNKTKLIVPKYEVVKAQKLGLSRNDLANSILIATNGMPIGAIYEGDKQLPIVLKSDSKIAENMEAIQTLPVWGQQSSFSVPLTQIVDSLKLEWEDVAVNRYNGKRALRVQADAVEGLTTQEAYLSVTEKLKNITVPDGYSLTWQGEVASQEEANESLFKFLPLAVGLMLIIVIALFNNFRQSFIVFSVVPLALVGLSLGFNITGFAFNFIAIIGTLGLIGMMIKNSIVLLDEININLRLGKESLAAIIDAAVSRFRPVMMASLTTILGMLPLITDPMFQAMSVAIMFGLLFGSVITLVVVPVIYALLFRVDVSSLKK